MSFKNSPKISVIIPTLNAEDNLRVLINSISKQTLLPEEIIIIDSSSSDNTAQLAAYFGCKVKVIPKSQFNHGGTRNLGASLASGEIIVFLTQDAIPRNEMFLERLIAPLNNSMVAASFGRQIAREDASPIERFTREFNYPDHSIIKSKDSLSSLGIKTFFFSDVCSAIRRGDFEKIGHFPEEIIMNEDMVLAARLILKGYHIAYTADAEVTHSHNYNASQQFKRNFDIGVSHNQNRWILEYARAEGEGLRYFWNQLSYLCKNGEYKWIPYAIWMTMAKYAGYKFGLNEAILPRQVKQKFSMHRFFWK